MKKSVIDEIGDMPANYLSNTKSQLLNQVINSVTDSLVHSAIDSISQRKVDLKNIGIQGAENMTKDVVYGQIKSRLDYPRIPRNFIAGYLAGNATEFVSSKLEDRQPHYFKAGITTGLGKVVYGEIKNCVEK